MSLADGRGGGPFPRLARARRRGLDRQRQLTVMHVDLVGSTPLAERLDPEDLRDIVLTYHDICDQAVERYGGDVGARAGDGLMVHFGLPLPHEDDAKRATLAGLAIVDAIELLADEVEGLHGMRIEVRVGIHTGPVVVTEIGNRRDIVGSTANETARIEGVAHVGTVAVSDATRRLIEDDFDFEDAREVELKGVARSVTIATVKRRTSATSRPQPLLPFIGRATERRRLLDAFERVAATDGSGPGQFSALIVGEAGLGKTRLAELVTGAALRQGARRLVLEHRSYDRDVPFHGWEAVVHDEFGLDRAAPAEDRLTALASELAELGLEPSLPYLATIVGLDTEQFAEVEGVDPSHWHQATASALTAWIDRLLAIGTVALVVEDLHWADPSTATLIDRLVRSERPGLFTLVTARDDTKQWVEAGVEVVALEPLSATEIATMGASLSGNVLLADEQIEQLIERSDGVPLYLDRLFDLARRDDLEWDSGVPDGLDQLLISVIGQPDIDQHLLGVLATIGRRLELELVCDVIDETDEAARQRLGRLCDLGVLDRTAGSGGAEYRFHHAMIQTAAYESQLPSDRRVAHAKIASVLEHRPSTQSLEWAAIAKHFDLAERPADAVPAYLRASAVAHRRGASLEARRLIERGMRLLLEQPHDADRDASELDLQLQMARCVLATEGYGAVAAVEASARALELTRVLDDPRRTFQIEVDLYSFYALRGDEVKATEMLQAMRRTATEHHLEMLVVDQMYALDLHRHGRFGEAGDLYQVVHAELSVLAEDNPTRALGGPADPLVAALSDSAPVIWQLGNTDLALNSLQRAIERAQQLSGPIAAFSEAYARSTLGQLQIQMGDLDAALETSSDTITLCNRKGLTMWGGRSFGHRLIVRAKLDPSAANEGKLGRLVARQRMIGTTTDAPFFTNEYATVCAESGNTEAALAKFGEALSVSLASGERRCVAEIYRRRALAKLAAGLDRQDAVTDLKEALSTSIDQTARVYGARAFRDLVNVAEAHDVAATFAPDVAAMLAPAPASSTGAIAEARALL